MVAIHLDANYIFNEPMKNRTEGEMIKAYQKIINRMKAAGLGLIITAAAVGEHSQRGLNSGALVTPAKKEKVRQRSYSPKCVSWTSPSEVSGK